MLQENGANTVIFSILIGFLYHNDCLILSFRWFISLAKRPTKFSILAREMRHNA